MIRKIILYVVGILLLLAAGFWAFLYYQRWSSYQVNIPAQADRVVRINLEQIGKKILKTADKSKMQQNELVPLVNKSFDLPFNLFAFGIKSLSTSVYFTKVKIADKEAFNELIGKVFPNGQDSLRHNATNTMSIMFNSEHAVVIWGKDTTLRVFSQSSDFLNNKNVVEFSKSQLYEVKEIDADLSSLGNMYNFAINFEQGKISGSFVSNVQQESPISLKVPKESALAVISKENFFSLLNKLGIKELTPNVSTQELNAYAHQGFALYINGETEQVKSVVTYEYDDNFEKVAVKKTEPVTVPNLNLKIPLSNEHTAMNSLLSAQVLIGADSVNNAILPLWNMKYFLKSGRTLFMYASQDLDTAIAQPVQLETDADLVAWIDFQKLSNMSSLAELKSYLSVFDQLSINHDTGDTYKIELSFQNKNRSSLAQLIDLIASR
ncbi:MAG: hypothetical protein BGO31_04920 [Bacteroidetes bacterium 43-16]|nr:MAG: hypothetical protein BGO31_04920 [Bacteroidetes bacterium 43-16]